MFSALVSILDWQGPSVRMSYKEKKFLDKKYSQGEIDGLLYGSSMEREDPFQDYFQGMHMLKGNSYFHEFQQQQYTPE